MLVDFAALDLTVASGADVRPTDEHSDSLDHVLPLDLFEKTILWRDHPPGGDDARNRREGEHQQDAREAPIADHREGRHANRGMDSQHSGQEDDELLCLHGLISILVVRYGYL